MQIGNRVYVPATITGIISESLVKVAVDSPEKGLQEVYVLVKKVADAK